MSIESREASEDTDRLCDDTIDLISSFSRMLTKAKAVRVGPATSGGGGGCPCGRSFECHRRQQLQQQQQQPVSSNASNLLNGNQTHAVGRVLTSPDEIRLLLRLESWIGDNGTLVVKPSLHREQTPPPQQQQLHQQPNLPLTMECGSFGNNSTLQPGPVPISDSSENIVDDCGAGGNGDCDNCEASEERRRVEQRQQGRLLKQQRKEQLEQLEPAVVSSAKLSRQQLLQQRRERLLAKRSASVAKASIGSARARRDQSVAAVSEPPQQQPTRRRTRGGSASGDSLLLIRKLQRLLNVEMKRSGLQ